MHSTCFLAWLDVVILEKGVTVNSLVGMFMELIAVLNKWLPEVDSMPLSVNDCAMEQTFGKGM